jgi:hypothetical protein
MDTQQYLDMVRKNGLLLEIVPKDLRSEEICLQAVKENGRALKYVINQTDAICITAVKHDFRALEYVYEQTEEICRAAQNKKMQVYRLVRNTQLRGELRAEYIEYQRQFINSMRVKGTLSPNILDILEANLESYSC